MPVEDSWKLVCHCIILWRECGKWGQWRTVGSGTAIVGFFGDNTENWTSGGRFEVALPLWDPLERIWKAGPVEESWELLCHLGILWRECGKLCQWKTVGSCFAIVELFGDNVVNCASGGRQLEVALPLWNLLERCGKLCLWKTVGSCSAIVEFFVEMC